MFFEVTFSKYSLLEILSIRNLFINRSPKFFFDLEVNFAFQNCSNILYNKNLIDYFSGFDKVVPVDRVCDRNIVDSFFVL